VTLSDVFSDAFAGFILAFVQNSEDIAVLVTPIDIYISLYICNYYIHTHIYIYIYICVCIVISISMVTLASLPVAVYK
jgi:hypothetical protein